MSTQNIIKEKPILFSTSMVEAILLGNKSQTRRVIKPQFKVLHAMYTDKSLETELIFRKGDQRIHCPYGQVGDRLWVRETFVLESDLEYVGDVKLPTDRPVKTIPDDGEWGEYHLIPHYRATEPEPNIVSGEQEDFDDRTRWKPSIFMPRWASRITLDITNTRAERLHDITGADLLEEGIAHGMGGFKAYKDLWNKLNGNWNDNPFVWVISFKRV